MDPTASWKRQSGKSQERALAMESLKKKDEASKTSLELAVLPELGQVNDSTSFAWMGELKQDDSAKPMSTHVNMLRIGLSTASACCKPSH